VAIFLLIIFSPIVYLLGKASKRITGVLSAAVSFVSFYLVVGLFDIPAFVKIEGPTFDLLSSFYFQADSLSLFIAIIPSSIGFLALIYSIKYIEEYHSSYYGLTLLFLGSMVGLAFTRNLLYLFIFLELSTISSMILVAHKRQSRSYEAAIKYAFIVLSASALNVIGVAAIYFATNTFDISKIQSAAFSTLPLTLAVACIFVGTGVKMAIFPLYTWLPDAHSEAPAPISSLLSGAMIEVGALLTFLMIFKVALDLFVDGGFLGLAICWLGVITMVLGAVMALFQTDVKRLLAYCSISQMGYIILAIGLATPLAVVAGLFHTLNHSITKALLFFNAGSLEHAFKTRNLDEMGAAANKMPITAITTIIGALSLAGMPFLCGFNSKWMIFQASLEAGQPIFAVIAMFVSAWTLTYLLKMCHSALFGLSVKKNIELKEPPSLMTIPMLILAFFSILFGIFPQLAVNYLAAPAGEILRNATFSRLDVYTIYTALPNGSWSPIAATILIAIAIILGYIFYRVGLRTEIKSEVTEAKKLPFTGGMINAPYLDVEEVHVTSAPFTFPSKPILNAGRWVHPGNLRLYLLWIFAFFLIMLGFVYLAHLLAE
jgi:formate hydrogenlyase subunit 3/multisubunit Na+/H+ antiporter MnhD subunit